MDICSFFCGNTSHSLSRGSDAGPPSGIEKRQYRRVGLLCSIFCRCKGIERHWPTCLFKMCLCDGNDGPHLSEL